MCDLVCGIVLFVYFIPTTVGIRRADHTTALLALTSPTIGGRSVDIVRSRT
jgi:hypothetical protein